MDSCSLLASVVSGRAEKRPEQQACWFVVTQLVGSACSVRLVISIEALEGPIDNFDEHRVRCSQVQPAAGSQQLWPLGQSAEGEADAEAEEVEKKRKRKKTKEKKKKKDTAHSASDRQKLTIIFHLILSGNNYNSLLASFCSLLLLRARASQWPTHTVLRFRSLSVHN